MKFEAFFRSSFHINWFQSFQFIFLFVNWLNTVRFNKRLWKTSPISFSRSPRRPFHSTQMKLLFPSWHISSKDIKKKFSLCLKDHPSNPRFYLLPPHFICCPFSCCSHRFKINPLNNMSSTKNECTILSLYGIQFRIKWIEENHKRKVCHLSERFFLIICCAYLSEWNFCVVEEMKMKRKARMSRFLRGLSKNWRTQRLKGKEAFIPQKL